MFFHIQKPYSLSLYIFFIRYLRNCFGLNVSANDVFLAPLVYYYPTKRSFLESLVAHFDVLDVPRRIGQFAHRGACAKIQQSQGSASVSPQEITPVSETEFFQIENQVNQFWWRRLRISRSEIVDTHLGFLALRNKHGRLSIIA